MRDPERIDEILQIIGHIWHENPDWRFNQLIVNAGLTGPRYHEEPAFVLNPHVEDDSTLEKLYAARARYTGYPFEQLSSDQP